MQLRLWPRLLHELETSGHVERHGSRLEERKIGSPPTPTTKVQTTASRLNWGLGKKGRCAGGGWLLQGRKGGWLHRREHRSPGGRKRSHRLLHGRLGRRGLVLLWLELDVLLLLFIVLLRGKWQRSREWGLPKGRRRRRRREIRRGLLGLLRLLGLLGRLKIQHWLPQRRGVGR